MKINKATLITISSVALAIFVIVLVVNSLSSHSAREWFNKSASNLTAGDILILVIVHALLNRAENKK